MLASVEKKERPIRIMQFGEGNFLRAFADYILQTANEKGLTDTNVAIVNPLAYDLPERGPIKLTLDYSPAYSDGEDMDEAPAAVEEDN